MANKGEKTKQGTRGNHSRSSSGTSSSKESSYRSSRESSSSRRVTPPVKKQVWRVKQQPSAAILDQLEEKEDFQVDVKTNSRKNEYKHAPPRQEEVKSDTHRANESNPTPPGTAGEGPNGPPTPDPAPIPWSKVYAARRAEQRNVLPQIRSTGDPDEDWDSFESTVRGYFLGKRRTAAELDGCLRQIKTWCNRFKISLARDEEKVLHLVRGVYLKQHAIDPDTATVVNPLDAQTTWDKVVSTVFPCLGDTAIQRRRKWEAGLSKAPKLSYKTSGRGSINRTIVDVCTQYSKEDAELEKLHPTAKFAYALYERCACKPKTSEVLLSVKGFSPLIARNCIHNEAKAICTRQLSTPIPVADPNIAILWEDAFNTLWEWSKPVVETKKYENDFYKWVSRYPEERRKMIMDAEVRLRERQAEVDPTTKAFVKREFITGKTLENFKPRLISGKTDEFLVQTGPEFYALDKATNALLFGPNSDIFITAGATREQIGAYFSERITEGAVIIEDDFKTFDGSQEKECISNYHKYLKKIMPGNEDVTELLARSTKTRGRGFHGHSYSREGSFDSGQIDTTKGNSLKNAAATLWVFKRLGIKIKIMLIGDDSIVFAYPTANQVINAVAIADLFDRLGLHATPIIRAEPWDAEYCNQLFWEISPGVYLPGAKPGRMLSKIFHTTKKFNTDDERRMHLRGLVLGEQANWHIPLLGQVFQWILDSIGDGPYKLRYRGDWEFGGNQRYQAGECVFDQFAYRYNLSRATMSMVTLPRFEFGVVLDGVFEHIVARDW